MLLWYVFLKVKVGSEKHLWTPDLKHLKKQCFDVTDLWLLAGCPRSGELNIIELE